MVSHRVLQSFVGDPADNPQVNQVNSYGGHPVAAAVAAHNIEILFATSRRDSAWSSDATRSW